MVRRYLVLRSDPSDRQLFKLLQGALDDLEHETGITLYYDFTDERPEQDLERQVYTEDEDRAILSVVDDFRTATRYLMLEARDESIAQEVMSALEPRLPVARLPELQADARQAAPERARSLQRLALGAGEEYDPETERIILDALSAADDAMRAAAAEAAAILQWPEFAAALRPITASDPSHEVRAVAAEALRACEQTSRPDERGR